MSGACEYHFNMKMLQIRNVPDELHRRMKARAALEGRTLSDFALDQLRRALDRPSDAELIARVRRREPVLGGPSSDQAVRAEREQR